ncbi:unnamed protein product [Rhizoctonia solani]|nr:unnamed protein product [Rhizoctonia solani]
MSGGVFLWATLAVKYIKKSAFPALPRLRKVLSKQKSPVTDHFDALYRKTLEMAIDDEEDDIKAAYLRCIGAILAISERGPLAAPDLQYLLLVAGQMDQLNLQQTIKNLGPLLIMTDGQRIRFSHPSFKEFVTNAARSAQFHIRMDQYEAEPAACCLQVMQRDLRFNICQLETSHQLNSEITDLKQRIDTHIGPALRYACKHWIDHFISSPTQALVKAIKTFLEGPRLMYWIEALSLLGRMDVAISGLSKLTELDLTPFNGSVVISWARDAHRFVLSFYDAITASTPHLYISALACAPRRCLTALRMRPHFPNTIEIAQGGDAYWHPCIKSTIHPHAVQTLSISPNGQRIVTGYPDGSLAIWDMETSAVSRSRESHRDVVTCAVFAPHGNLVASSSHDATIRLWNVTEGLQDSRILAGHSGPVHSVAFSPTSTLIASGSSDRTIRLWDPNAARPLHGPYIEHSSRITSVAFSPDGTKLVSGSWDKTIRVWSVDLSNLGLGNNPLVIAGHSDSVTCVLFSPDGSKIASGSVDKTIQIWDAQTGTKSVPYTSPAKHSDSVTSIAFSPNGGYVGSCSLDGAIQLWDAITMSAYSQPFGHSSPVNVIAFSSDGCHLISGSTDMTTRAWQVDACPKPMTMGPLAGHSSAVASVAVTPDGTRIVSASNDKTVRIWDAQTGALVGDPLTGHSHYVYCVAVSPDGARIVSGSQDKLMKLWDTATHANIQSYEHSSYIWCAAFSPNGAQIAFGTGDNNVYLWDVTEWKMIKQGLQGHSGQVSSVTFSPDGTCLASASDKTVILWDIASHSRIGGPLSGHTDQVKSVAFSPCGTRLASGSHDRTIKVWDRHTRTTVHTLTGHGHYVYAVAFSPDGSCIASGSEDKTVRLWNAKTGQLIGQPFTEHSSAVNSIAFSPDGNYLISSSYDNKIQVRNIAASYPANEPETEPPNTFRWPSNPYNMSSHPEHPGWVTHNRKSHVLWLPAHYEQRDKFLEPSPRACPPVRLDYSKFVHGTAWTKVARDPTSGGS